MGAARPLRHAARVQEGHRLHKHTGRWRNFAVFFVNLKNSGTSLCKMDLVIVESRLVNVNVPC